MKDKSEVTLEEGSLPSESEKPQDKIHPDSNFDDLDPQNTHAIKGDNSDGQTEWSFKKMLAALSLAGLYVAGSIPTLLIGSSLSYVATDLDAKFVVWLITANTLVVAATTPFVGSLTDLFGPRYILLGAGLFLMMGMVIFGTAHHFGQAVVGSVFAGLGCGVLELTTIAGIAELAPIRLRSLYLSFLTFAIVPFNPYAFYTQELCRNATWRWVVWVILIWTGVWWVLCALTYFPKRSNYRIKGLTNAEILKRLDWIGAVLSVAGVTLILVPLQDGGYRYPWKSAHVIAPLIIGVIVLIAFVIWEGWYAQHPMVPHALLHEKGVVIPLAVASVAGFAYYSVLSYFPSMLQYSYYQESPTRIGVLSEGYSLGLLLGATLTNASLSYVNGNVKWPILFACVLMTAFTGALMSAKPGNQAFIASMGALATFGVGGILVPPVSVALTCCPDSLIATVSGLGMCVRTLGGSIGTTIYSAIFQNKVKGNLPAQIAKYAIEAGLPLASVEAFVTEFLETGGNVTSVPGITPKILSQAFLGQAWGFDLSFKYVWAASVAFGGLACIMCFFIPNTQRYLTNRIAVG